MVYPIHIFLPKIEKLGFIQFHIYCTKRIMMISDFNKSPSYFFLKEGKVAIEKQLHIIILLLMT